MKKTKTLPRKLVLTTETLRKLTPEQLQAVNAGLRKVGEDSSVMTAGECN